MPHYEADTYDCKITGQAYGKSKVKATPLICLSFRPENGEYERNVNLYITDKTVTRLVEWFGRQGVKPANWSDMDLQNGGTVSMIGKVVQLQCRHEPSQDGSQLYESWGTPMPPKNLLPAHLLESSDLRSLDRAYGSALKGNRNLKPAAPQVAKPTPPPAPTETNFDQDVGDIPVGDDIPF